MSNKEMSEIDETQEKTEDKIKTSEEAANNLEISEPYTQETSSASEGNTNQQNEASENPSSEEVPHESIINEIKEDIKNLPPGSGMSVYYGGELGGYLIRIDQERGIFFDPNCLENPGCLNTIVKEIFPPEEGELPLPTQSPENLPPPPPPINEASENQRRESRQGEGENPQYETDQNQRYGPHWGNSRPPGLPDNARGASRAGEALPYIENNATRIGREQGFSGRNLDTFVRTVTHLARTESQGRFGLPANNFDARQREQRPPDRPRITAWGVFQFNAPAWQWAVRRYGHLYGISPEQANRMMPWEATSQQEIEIPIHVYAEIYRNIINAGGSDIDAARGVRLWHRSPAAYRDYFERGRQNGFNQAWQGVNRQHRGIIDGHLRNAGILR